ncbi:unnamed protein product, partial [marine sediment metagenome]
MKLLGLQRGPTDYVPHLYSTGKLHKIRFPQVPYLIHNWLPRGGRIMLHGRQEQLKSWLATTLANCLAKGEPFMDYECEKSRVVYVQLDMTPQTQHERIQLAEGHLEHNNLRWVLGSLPHSIELVKLKDEWVQEVREFKPDLVIWDSLRRM